MGEHGGVSGRVQFCDWRSKAWCIFNGQIPVASNALKMFFCVYAAALACMTSQLEKLLMESIEIPGVCLLMELALLTDVSFFSHPHIQLIAITA
jgi:hypothetical protein